MKKLFFFGWMKAGKIQGLNKVRRHNIKAVCGSGTAQTAEPDDQTVMTRNKIEGIPFFYLRGGCLPLKEIKGMDKIMLSMFLNILKSRKDKNDKIKEAIFNVENGFDGVKEENLEPVLEWLNAK